MTEPTPRQCLAAWQRQMLTQLNVRVAPAVTACADVTFVAYWFWNDDRFVTDRYAIQVPILMTRRYCGNIPGVLIANRTDRDLERFCERQAVQLIVDSSLVGGTRQLNTDYIANLHTRFDTTHCLTIQDDGFPLQPGLDRFVDRYDYVGAPWDLTQDDWIGRMLLFRSRPVGNGGFSLRTHAICERASWYYRRRYKLLPFCFLLQDDFFFCRVLPTYEPSYRRSMRFAPAAEAALFSVERHWEAYRAAGAQTFGFHGAAAFQRLIQEGRVAQPTAAKVG